MDKAAPQLNAERRFQLLVEAVVDYAIFMLDPNGFITTWSPGAKHMKHYEPDEIIGQHFSVFFTREDRLSGKPERALDTARRTGRFEDEGLRVRKDGTHFWANAIVDAIRGEDAPSR